MIKKVGIIGGSGFAGEELIKFLSIHQNTDLIAVSSRDLLGTKVSEIVEGSNLSFVDPNDAIFYDCDVVFFSTPHGVAMKRAKSFIEKDIKIIDLSADFRIKDTAIWKKWYGSDHEYPEGLQNSIYGLTELNIDSIKSGKLIAVPGCYPTASILGLLPVIPHLQKNSKIILDAKSGISGAGKSSVENGLEEDIKENFKSYNVGFHRHQPEIKDFLKMEFNLDHEIIFIPHLLPLFRGEYVTLYCEVSQNDLDLNELYESYYEKHKLVRVKEKGEIAEIKEVINTFYCDISVSYAFQSNTIVVNSAIDNLLKGAASQAIQCLDIMSS